MQKKATWPEVAIKHGNTTKFGVPAFISVDEWANILARFSVRSTGAWAATRMNGTANNEDTNQIKRMSWTLVK